MLDTNEAQRNDLRREPVVKLLSKEKEGPRLELNEYYAIACDMTCIAEGERDRVFWNLLSYGFRSL